MTYSIVCFPFTHMTKTAEKTVRAFFDGYHRFDVQSAEQAKDGHSQGKKNSVLHHLDHRTVAKADHQFLQYREWGNIHKGNAHHLRALLTDSPYFRNDNQVTAIKSRLKAVEKDQTGDMKDPDTVIRHLLFLKTAHLYDVQNERVDEGLADLDKSKELLFTELRGLDEAPPPDVRDEDQAANDSGTLMTRERIVSWTACMSATGFYPAEQPFVFVTTSPAVFEYLESICETSVNALDIDEIKVHENDCANKKEWHKVFAGIVIRAVQGDEIRMEALPLPGDDCEAKGQCSIKFFSGNEINRHFNLSDTQVIVCLVRLK